MGQRRDLAGKRAVVTGASSGIGRATAVELARRGVRVVAAARSADKLQALAAECPGVLPVVADVTVPADRERLVATAVETLGGLDLLVNAAGVGAFGHFVDLTPEIARQLFEVNYFGLAETCRAALPALKTGDRPMIVNVSSMTGRRTVPAWTDYGASKAAVCGFSEGLRAELARFDIDVLLVVPGLTQTGLGDALLANKGKRAIDFSRGLPAATVARRMGDAMASGKHELRTELEARTLLFLNWLAPRFVDWRLAALVRRLYADERGKK